MIITKKEILFLADFFKEDVTKYSFKISESDDDDDEYIKIKEIYFYNGYYIIEELPHHADQPFYSIHKNISEELTDQEHKKLKELKLVSKIKKF